ncbi:restriction endonuclease subunit S [Neptuniibacter pectenicola]|uniref:restriction endonuclease subunit S n=1 Tax=Neptuniibacter pectenicola TaxID=1806669 RepID=UPI00082CC648|nr:restriction endonuclease subunit S [Neptuniibacter pectenicola]
MSWPLVNINDICRPKQWKTVSSSKLLEEGYPVYGANGRIGYYSEYTHEFPTLMITCRGATCGNVHISVPKAYINGNAMALDGLDSEKYSIKYLFYYFKSRGFNDVISGSAQPQITRQGLSKIEIPLPPLPVQKQIAAVLEKADTLRSQCQQMEQELNSLAQSLFLDMFGDPVTNPKGWEQRTLQDVCSKVTDGTHQAPEWAEKGVPFLFISNIRNGQVDFNTNKFITERCYKELTRTTPIEINDILYTTVGSYGHVSIVDETFPKFCFQRHIAQIKPDKNKVNPSFLFYQLQTSAIKHLADVAVRGIAQKTLNLKDLKSFTILLPPKDLQAKLVERMDIIKSQSIRINTVSAKNHELFNSLMQRAFKGELELKDVA